MCSEMQWYLNNMLEDGRLKKIYIFNLKYSDHQKWVSLHVYRMQNYKMCFAQVIVNTFLLSRVCQNTLWVLSVLAKLQNKRHIQFSVILDAL